MQTCTGCTEKFTLSGESDSTHCRIYGEIKNGKPYCHRCLEALDFADFLGSEEKEESEVRSVKTVEKVSVVKSRTFISCPKCNIEMTGTECASCKIVNPLMMRKPKKGKKRRGKR